jgi:uncharacterized membrane protein YkoI
MKLKTLIAVAALTFIFAACGTPYQATTSGTVVVSDQMRSSFNAQYPNATNVVWSNYDPAASNFVDWDLAGWNSLDAGDYLVRFNMDNEDYYGWYDNNGEWIGTAYVLRDYHSLPSAINTTITNRYPGYTISSVNREFQKDRMTYQVELTKDNMKVKVLIDDNGNVIKEKTKSM